MKATFLAAAALALTTATAALSAPERIGKIDVSADLSAIKNEKAAVYWTHVSDDLENAIVARLTEANRIAPEGEKGDKVSIDLDEVSLATTYEAAIGSADSKIAGQIDVTNESGDTHLKSYELAVTMDVGSMIYPAGTDVSALTTDSAVHYQVMIDAFADNVVKGLD